MNTSPEAVRARAEADANACHVFEAILDGDYEDAKRHLRLWNERRVYALSFERIASEHDRSLIDPDYADARRLLKEVYEHFAFSDQLPDHLRANLFRFVSRTGWESVPAKQC